MNIEDRKEGYKAGLTSAGEWLKSREVGLIAKGGIAALQKEALLKEDHYLFAITKEELEKLKNGEMPG